MTEMANSAGRLESRSEKDEQFVQPFLFPELDTKKGEQIQLLEVEKARAIENEKRCFRILSLSRIVFLSVYITLVVLNGLGLLSFSPDSVVLLSALTILMIGGVRSLDRRVKAHNATIELLVDRMCKIYELDEKSSEMASSLTSGPWRRLLESDLEKPLLDPLFLLNQRNGGKSKE